MADGHTARPLSRTLHRPATVCQPCSRAAPRVPHALGQQQGHACRPVPHRLMADAATRLAERADQIPRSLGPSSVAQDCTGIALSSCILCRSARCVAGKRAGCPYVA